MRIPFVDLAAQYASIRDEVDAAIKSVIQTTCFVGGDALLAFEKRFAEYCGAKHALGVANGTDALQIALRVLEISPGDEVITTTNTFIATASAIIHAGGRPVFVDIDPDTYTLDPALVEHAITPQTKAIIAVHLYGQPADMDPILEVARRHKLFVIEDAAQAHGAEYKGRRVGSIGDIGCFSFYPSKNLGAYGDGGAIVTNSEDIAQRVEIMRDHGRSTKYKHSHVGFNSRLDTLQAAILDVKLRYLDQWNQERRRAAGWYSEELSSTGVRVPCSRSDATHVYHLYVIQANNRDSLRQRLDRLGISTGIHYPLPLHLQAAFASLGYGRGSFRRSEQIAGRILSLPIFPELTRQQAAFIASAIRETELLRAQQVTGRDEHD